MNMSAKTGRHMEKLVPALEAALASWDRRIPTARLNAFLAGQAQGRGLEDSLHIGAIAAAEVISHYGARPEADLAAVRGPPAVLRHGL